MRCRDGPYCPHIHVAGDAPRPRPWAIPQRRLSCWLLVCVLDGEEQVVIAGESLLIRRGGAYLIEPGQRHDLGAARSSTPAWLHFDLVFDSRRSQHPAAAGPYESDLGSRATYLQPGGEAVFGASLPIQPPSALGPDLPAEMARLVRAWCQGGLAGAIEAEARLSLIMARWAAGVLGTGNEAAGDRLAQAEAVARASLDRPFAVAEFAAAAGLSRARFSAAWTARHGEAPGNWLRRLRLEEAERLLLSTDLSVADVGRHCGYHEPSVFARAFNARKGLTPAAWRKAHRGRVGH